MICFFNSSCVILGSLLYSLSLYFLTCKRVITFSFLLQMALRMIVVAEESLDLFFLFDRELIHYCTTITHILRSVNDIFLSETL